MSTVVPFPDGINTDINFTLGNWTSHTIKSTKSDGLWFLQLVDCTRFRLCHMKNILLPEPYTESVINEKQAAQWTHMMYRFQKPDQEHRRNWEHEQKSTFYCLKRADSLRTYPHLRGNLHSENNVSTTWKEVVGCAPDTEKTVNNHRPNRTLLISSHNIQLWNSKCDFASATYEVCLFNKISCHQATQIKTMSYFRPIQLTIIYF